MQVVVFLGAGYLSNYDYAELKELKKILVCGDYSKTHLKAEIAAMFEEIYVIETLPFEDKSVEIYTLPDLEETMSKLVTRYPNLYLYCEDEKSLIVAAQVREKLNLSGHKVKDVLPFRNKILMKDLVCSLGIRAPKYSEFSIDRLKNETEQYFYELENTFGLPFVVKPVELAGAYGVNIIHTLKDFMQVAKNIDSRVTYEVEEFVSGELYHYDAVIDRNGKIVFDETCKYSYPCVELLNGKVGASILLTHDDPLQQNIIAFGRQIISKLNLLGVVIHLELFKKEGTGELVFLETAIRPGGGQIRDVYYDVFGLNIFNANLFTNLGIAYTINRTPKIKYYCAGTIPSQKGTVKKLNKPVLKETNELIYNISVGDKLMQSVAAGNNVGFFKFFGNSKDDFNHDLETILKFNFIEISNA